jgi:hypothetical protein
MSYGREESENQTTDSPASIKEGVFSGETEASSLRFRFDGCPYINISSVLVSQPIYIKYRLDRCFSHITFQTQLLCSIPSRHLESANVWLYIFYILCNAKMRPIKVILMLCKLPCREKRRPPENWLKRVGSV